MKSMDETEQLTLMTLHAAKGTEFPIVIIIGMEEGSFPMWKQNITETELEEERRRLLCRYDTRTKPTLSVVHNLPLWRQGSRIVYVCPRDSI